MFTKAFPNLPLYLPKTGIADVVPNGSEKSFIHCTIKISPRRALVEMTISEGSRRAIVPDGLAGMTRWGIWAIFGLIFPIQREFLAYYDLSMGYVI
jgi:hypothetical protein